MRRVLLSMGILGIGLALAACTSTTAAAPTVVWDGGEPSGDLEADPWVQTVRASDLALSIAGVTHDYTAADLSSSTARTTITQAANAQRSAADSGRFYTFPGPTPMLALSVTETADGATVTMCQAQDWYLDDQQSAVPDPPEGRVAEFAVTTAEDGTRQAEGSVVHQEECDLSDAHIGTFDPQPDPTATYTADDVKGP